MPNMQALPADHPEMKAWERYKNTPEHENTLKWAHESNYTEGSLWAAFDEGWRAAMETPANPVPAPEIQHILSSKQRNLLITACAYLRLMQEHYPKTYGWIESTRKQIYEMVNGK